jgi:hypothetical protein
MLPKKLWLCSLCICFRVETGRTARVSYKSEVSSLYCLKIDVGVCPCLSRAMIITGCAIELAHTVVSCPVL